VTALDPSLQAWLVAAVGAAERGDEAPPPVPALDDDDDEVPAPKRPLPGWTDREFAALLRAQLQPTVAPCVSAWPEAVRRVVGLHRRDPFAAARARAPGRVAACGLLARWSALLAVATWRTGDLPTLDAVLTLLDALDRPLVRAALRLAHAHDRELVRLARQVAEARMRGLEVAR
jgi:hypothetical protein